MKNYIKHHPWKIIEDHFDPSNHRVSESIFSIGNGKFGHRANFEETYSGDSLQGNYVAGVYYPDKTRVGWWKNGYPEYFAKVLNAPNWLGIELTINGQLIDLAKDNIKILDFKRELDMKRGVLHRTVRFQTGENTIAKIESTRFCSLSDSNLGCLQYTLTVEEGSAEVRLKSFIDGKIKNADSNYNEKFWKGVKSSSEGNTSLLITKTKKTDFHVGIICESSLKAGNKRVKQKPSDTSKKYVSSTSSFKLKKGEAAILVKKVIITSSLDCDKKSIASELERSMERLSDLSYEDHLNHNIVAWAKKWEESDILIEGDVSAQQAIRFNIFQLNCTYTGEDERLNIGPKGFTGEKYGGSTYWDTEAYCLPFYLATADEHVSKNLLKYRHNHLPKAIENAEKLGFNNGAALYPMVTMNGEECHNEWEITFEEIHRNGAIAYAIYDFTRYTNDWSYLAEYGLEVLIGISRFWKQRVNWSEDKQAYVMLGVTGPNEFENNINNNWYTNKLAVWCLNYTTEMLSWLEIENKAEHTKLIQKTNFKRAELKDWKIIIGNMYYPYSEEHGVFLQQDGFLDKELIPVRELPESERPIVEHWSWDRILRSCYIKQADTLQGFYLFEDEYDLETIKKHYNFYEPLTVHESSLSPCVHSILAAKIGDSDRAYAFYLRTARLDLDDYNNDTRDGLHITSMAGTWMSIVQGFAGMRVRNDELSFSPFLPKNWTMFSFQIRFRGKVSRVTIDKNGAKIEDLLNKVSPS
jgi:maltose phosphorylase